MDLHIHVSVAALLHMFIQGITVAEQLVIIVAMSVVLIIIFRLLPQQSKYVFKSMGMNVELMGWAILTVRGCAYMNSFYKKPKVFSITILAVVLLVGLALVVSSLQQKQNAQSEAASQVEYNAFEVTNSSGKQLPFKDTNGTRTYDTESLDVKIRVNDLEKLAE